VLLSCTLGSPPSVSKARKRSPGDWVFLGSRIDAGSSVPRREWIPRDEGSSNGPHAEIFGRQILSTLRRCSNRAASRVNLLKSREKDFRRKKRCYRIRTAEFAGSNAALLTLKGLTFADKP
jgi:hypothetical protein